MTELYIPGVEVCPACARAKAGDFPDDVTICEYHYYSTLLQMLLAQSGWDGMLVNTVSNVFISYVECFGEEIRQEARRC